VTTVFVDHFGYALGERKTHVTESARAGRLLSAASDLESAGFRWHHICAAATTAYDLARAAVSEVAESGGLADADAIVYATCLPCNGNMGSEAAWESSRDVKHLMQFPASCLQADFGLSGAVVVGLCQQACTSMLGSLRLAGALLTAEPAWRRVLCVTADRFPAGARYEQAYNLISDGAAACVVSRGPAGFRLVTAHQITNGGLAQAGDDETVGSYFSYTHKLIRETLDRARMTTADLDWIVTQNTSENAWRILAKLLCLDHGRVWAPSLPDVGHVISADNVVNLLALRSSGRLEPGQKIALVMAGFGLNWQCVILEAAR
jgi:3-oxoacyl-[acyl-carrier-protein] synthase-3